MEPIRAQGEDYDWHALLLLIGQSYASMAGRIEPPSPIHRQSVAEIARQAETGEVWVLEQDSGPVACIFLAPHPDALYLSKIAVAAHWRNQGLARMLVSHAETRARAMGLPAIELESPIEMVENHATFTALGFSQTGSTTHEDFDSPTSLTFRKTL